MNTSTPPAAGLSRRALLIAAAASAAGYLAVPAGELPANAAPPATPAETPPQARPHRTLLGVL
jgi:hypothetical protein